MKITIDTKEDSHEEIKNIIKMLSSLVAEGLMTNQPNVFESSEPSLPEAPQESQLGSAQGENQFGSATPEGQFSNAPQGSQFGNAQREGQQQSGNAFASMFKEQEDDMRLVPRERKEDAPQIIEYD